MVTQRSMSVVRSSLTAAASLFVSIGLISPTSFAGDRDGLCIGLASYWDFDATAEDAVGSADGVVTGAGFVPGCVVGGCLDFDGNGDFVTVSSPPIGLYSTISYWAYLDHPTSPTGPQAYTMSFNDRDDRGIAFGNGTSNYLIGETFFWVSNTPPATIDGYLSSIPAGWHHYALVFQAGSGTYDLFIDGSLVSVGRGTGGSPDQYGDEASMLFGKRVHSNDLGYLNGRLDEVGIWNRALTSDEVSALYNDGIGLQNPCSGPLPCGTFVVSGPRILDAACEEVVLRGINHPLFADEYDRNNEPCNYGVPAAHSPTGFFASDAIPFIRNRGFNSVRLVWRKEGDNVDPMEWTRRLKVAIDSVIRVGMIPIVELHHEDGAPLNDPAELNSRARYWRDFWLGLTDNEQARYRKHLIINIMNEWGDWLILPTFWRDSYITAITIVRGGGFDGLLMIDAPGWGQNPLPIQQHGRSLLDADIENKLVFGLHIYDTFFFLGFDLDVIGSIVDEGIPLVIGEFGPDHADMLPDPVELIMESAVENEVGYVGWSWQLDGTVSAGGECNPLLNATLTVDDDDVPPSEPPEPCENPANECWFDFRDWTGTELTLWGETLITHPLYGVQATAQFSSVFPILDDAFEFGDFSWWSAVLN